MHTRSIHPMSTPNTPTPTPMQPFHFGRWLGEGNERAMAAFWYTSKQAMIPYLAGYLQTVTEPAYRRAAQMLYDDLMGVSQTCNPQDNGESYDSWRYPNVY